ncbi:MAG: hypothetical protein H0T79_23915 [Deltaproteobacteria bacterium]|nr:hypothetical protein [Deltaproteobacteria bacterium]
MTTTTKLTSFGVPQDREIEGVWGVDTNALAPDGDIPLSFNQQVTPAEGFWQDRHRLVDDRLVEPDLDELGAIDRTLRRVRHHH